MDFLYFLKFDSKKWAFFYMFSSCNFGDALPWIGLGSDNSTKIFWEETVLQVRVHFFCLELKFLNIFI